MDIQVVNYPTGINYMGCLERSHSTMEDQLRAPFEQLCIRVLWCSRGFRGRDDESRIPPFHSWCWDASLLVCCTFDHWSFSDLAAQSPIFESTIDSEGFKGGTRGAPIMPRDAVSRTANVERTGPTLVQAYLYGAFIYHSEVVELTLA